MIQLNLETIEIIGKTSYLIFEISLIAVVIILAVRLKDTVEQRRELNKPIWEKEKISNIRMDKVDRYERGSILKKILCPMGIDSSQDSYIKITDGGKEKYIRSFTITHMKKVVFGETVAALYNFDNCISSTFIKPIDNDYAKGKLNRRLNLIDGDVEKAANEGDKNSYRNSSRKYGKLSGWVNAVEDGETSFYEVTFLFSLYADSLEELNVISDEFHNLANRKDIRIASCYGLQSEAYASQLPLNQVKRLSFINKGKTLSYLPGKKIIFDTESLGAIYNLTSADFSHENGVPVGHNMDTGKITKLDPYDKSHDGFSICVAGKTGAGKSASIKEMVLRSWVLKGYRFCGIDSQKRGNKGEYAGLAVRMGGNNIQIKNGGGVTLNFLEINENEEIDLDTKRTYKTLKLYDKISEAESIIMSMLNRREKIDSNATYILECINSCLKEIYSEKGIVEGDVESLYEYGTVIDPTTHNIVNGRRRKKAPELNEFYKKVVKYMYKFQDRDADRASAAKRILSGLSEDVREVYYSEVTGTILTQEDYEKADSFNGEKWITINGKKEAIVVIKGTKAYFDGQSTVEISEECPYTNFDISMLPEEDKRLAREIAMSYINENFVKKNSADPRKSSYLVVILDECHENFEEKYMLTTIDNLVRTGRKLNVSIWIITQNVTDYMKHEITKDIFKQSTMKLVFKQDASDEEKLKKMLTLTDAQLKRLLRLGGTGDLLDSNNKDAHKHRGECCIIDNKRVWFSKFEYEFFKPTEQKLIDTSAEIYRETFGKDEEVA